MQSYKRVKTQSIKVKRERRDTMNGRSRKLTWYILSCDGAPCSLILLHCKSGGESNKLEQNDRGGGAAWRTGRRSKDGERRANTLH